MTNSIEASDRAHDILAALRSSTEQLGTLVAPLDDDALGHRAYPSEWSVADVMSHIGSSAEIMQRRVDDARLGQPTPDDFAPSVWDIWNAKSVRARADDGLRADRALIDALDELAGAGGGALEFAMGPMTFDFANFVGLRLNEQLLHTWDIDVSLDPSAALPATGAAIAVDNVSLVGRYTARPTGATRTINARTTNPTRSFTVALTPESVKYAVGDDEAEPDVTLPAEAWIRLVYGRLDAEHTPAFEGDVTALETLRQVYPGP